MAEPSGADRTKLQDAEQVALLNSILESSTEYSIVAMDLSGTILAWNEGARRTYGDAAGEVVGKATTFMLHDPDDVKSGRAQAILDEARQAGKWEGDLVRVRKDGSRFHAHVTKTLRRGPTGEPSGFTMISRDLTESERMERELRESQEYNRGLIESNIRCIPLMDGSHIRTALGGARLDLTDGSLIQVLPFSALRVRDTGTTTELSLLYGRLTFGLRAGKRVEIRTSSARLEPEPAAVSAGELFVDRQGRLGLEVAPVHCHIRRKRGAAEPGRLGPARVPVRGPAG